MERRIELLLVTLILLLAAGLRIWDLTRLPPGFSADELAYIRMSTAVRDGEVAVYYQTGDGQTRASFYAVLNTLSTALVGDGLMGYRILSLGLGLLTLAVLYRLGRRLFGPSVALIALALMAINLRAVLLARSATAASFVPLYLLLTLLCLVIAFHLRREIRFRAPATLPFVLLALLFGGSGYAHYTALVLGPLGAIFCLHLILTGQPISRRVWNIGLFVMVLATVIALPYLISTLRDHMRSEPYLLWTARPHNLSDGLHGLLNAISGFIYRGDSAVVHNVSRRPLLDAGSAILFLLGIGASIRRWRDPRYALLLMVLAAGLLTDAWVGRDTSFDASIIALPAVFLLIGVGTESLVRLLKWRGVRHAWRVATVAVVGLIGLNLLLTEDRLFDHWRHDPNVARAYNANMGYLAAYLDRTPDGLPLSMCSVGLREQDDAGMTPREVLGAMMHREGIRIRHSDCRGGLVFIDAGGPMRFAFTNQDDLAQMPPELADWLKDGQPIRVDGLPDGSVMRLDVRDRIENAGGYDWGTLAPTYFEPETNGKTGRVDLPITLVNNLTFAGYDPRVLSGERKAGGEPIVLVTYWRVDGVLPSHLGIFAHVVPSWENLETGERLPDTGAAPWAQANSIDVIPGELQNRDFFAQVSYIWLSDSLRTDVYELMVGAYDDSISNRLVVLDNGQPHGDRLWLGPVSIASSTAQP